MMPRKPLGLACLLSLFALAPSGCGGGGASRQTNIVFDLERHHYALTNAYYNVLGLTPMTAYTLELSQLGCDAQPRALGTDVDLQIFAQPSGTTYKVKVEFPDPAGYPNAAGMDTFVEGSGTVIFDEAPPQVPFSNDYDTNVKAVAALDAVLTGTVELTMTGGGQTINASGPFTATHCPRMDNP
jgi:hypothetical protein